jgi:hypothetical protein
MKYISIYNNQAIALHTIPELSYNEFMNSNLEMLSMKPERHCVNYFGYKTNNNIRLMYPPRLSMEI